MLISFQPYVLPDIPNVFMNLQDLHDIVFETLLLYLKDFALSEGITVGLIASWATPKNLLPVSLFVYIHPVFVAITKR